MTIRVNPAFQNWLPILLKKMYWLPGQKHVDSPLPENILGTLYERSLTSIFSISFSAIFIEDFFTGSSLRPMKGIIPSTTVAASFVVSFVVTVASERAFCCDIGWVNRFIHIGIGAVCLLCVLVSVLLTENEFVLFLKEQWTGRRKKDD